MYEIIQEITPCVNYESIKKFVGKYVVVYGKISSIRNNLIYLNINPGKDINI